MWSLWKVVSSPCRRYLMASSLACDLPSTGDFSVTTRPFVLISVFTGFQTATSKQLCSFIVRQHHCHISTARAFSDNDVYRLSAWFFGSSIKKEMPCEIQCAFKSDHVFKGSTAWLEIIRQTRVDFSSRKQTFHATNLSVNCTVQCAPIALVRKEMTGIWVWRFYVQLYLLWSGAPLKSGTQPLEAQTSLKKCHYFVLL